jgi:carboxyl-terminal processing protease
MTKNKFISFTLVAALAFSIWSFRDPGARYFEIAKNLDIFATLFKEVNQFYVDEINPTKLINVGIEAMLNSLDPYTDFYPEEEIEDYRTMTTNEYAGVGMQIAKRDNSTIITMIHKGFSAANQGLRIGDEIISINGNDISERDGEEINQLMKGQAQSEIVLSVKRFGVASPITIKVKREKVTIPNVSYSGLLRQDVAYIKLTDFTTNASKEVRDALVELKEQGATKLILDLRGNPGGLLSEAVNVSNLFVPKGSEIVSTRGKIEDWNKTYHGLNQPLDLDIPIVVLTSSTSASAAEIVAGVIQDYDRGVLVGEKTFGKGLVQATRPLSYNSQLKITTAKYYIPSGRCIQAIDYAESGSAKLPDSLKAAFTTKNGRLVYDGAGIDPDLLVPKLEMPPVIAGLLQEYMIFDFVTENYAKIERSEDPLQFQVDDKLYNEFKDWLNKKNFDYTTRIEQSLKMLEDVSREEKYYEGIKNELKELQDRVAHKKDLDLEKFKDEISDILKQEFVSRKFYREGAIKVSFANDQDVLEAIDLLSNKARYDKFLSK